MNQLVRWLQERRVAAYRAGQILKWVYQRQAECFEEMTDLAKDLRRELADRFFIGRLRVDRVADSADGTRKYLFELADGHRVESVLIPEKGHRTLCISSQAGCAQGCRFCMTGRRGLRRNLTRGEIVAQVRDIAATLAGHGAERLTNIVFMGMGEPLANYGQVVGAIETLLDREAGLGFSKRRITLSTAGVVPRLAALGRDAGVNLAVSLNAADNETRSRLMPINRKHPIEELIAACRRYPLDPGRRITFEYVLLEGVNDAPRDARRLADLLRPVRAKINLIPFNAFEGCAFRRPSAAAVAAFQQVLVQRNYVAVVRHSKGRDIAAACGQLRAGGAEGARPGGSGEGRGVRDGEDE